MPRTTPIATNPGYEDCFVTLPELREIFEAELAEKEQAEDQKKAENDVHAAQITFKRKCSHHFQHTSTG
jgi:hypothetical protein